MSFVLEMFCFAFIGPFAAVSYGKNAAKEDTCQFRTGWSSCTIHAKTRNNEEKIEDRKCFGKDCSFGCEMINTQFFDKTLLEKCLY